MQTSQIHQKSSIIIDEVERAIVGKRDVLEMVMAAVLINGHVLFEDFPGLGKTLMARSLASALGLEFKRIQFTPDLLPGDITGGYVFDREKGSFSLRKGPIFTSILLADEINRASPKTQSALLEAMQEHQVTIEGETLPLPKPFIVFATQNPIEYEGTFPLPEAQLDRFSVKLEIGYPAKVAEHEILRRRKERKRDEVDITRVIEKNELAAMQSAVEDVIIDSDIEKYIVDLVDKTRDDSRVSVGASPRGSLALLKLSCARAARDGRDFVLPDDVKAFTSSALAHRLILQPDLWMRQRAAVDVIEDIVKRVPVPVISEAGQR